MADRTESRITIQAPAAAILDVIADFDSYPEWTGAVKQTETLVTDVDGWAEQVKFVLDAGAIKDTYTLGYDWDVDQDGSGTVSWHLVEGQMLKAMQGSYELRSTGVTTDVTYRLAVDLKIPMLGMLRRKAEKVIIETALNELKKRVEG
ncbi:MAG: SRPBCC family protein [Actinomycetales bacterium]|jgi:ribosome-associated toxin RatA of RatAB toxin-antitoxin module